MLTTRPAPALPFLQGEWTDSDYGYGDGNHNYGDKKPGHGDGYGDGEPTLLRVVFRVGQHINNPLKTPWAPAASVSLAHPAVALPWA